VWFVGDNSLTAKTRRFREGREELLMIRRHCEARTEAIQAWSGWIASLPAVARNADE
jgi:hypothetical protein